MGACECGRCDGIALLLRRLPDEAWPWRAMGAVIALIGLLLFSGMTAALVLAGATVAAVPELQEQLGSCLP